MGTAYVANYASRSISVIDTLTHSLKGAVNLPYAPYALAPPTCLDQLWILMGPNIVGVIDLINHRLIVTIKIPHRATAVALTPCAQRAYVTNWEGDTGYLTIIDVATHTIIKTLTLEFSFPVDAAVSPNGKRFYVVSSNPSYLIAFNQRTDQIIKFADTDCYSNKIAVSSDSKRAYITNSEECQSLSVIDLETNDLLENIPLTRSYPGYIAITPDHRYAYITHEPVNRVSVVNLTSNTLLRTFTCLGSPTGIAMTDDNKYAYIVQNGKNRVAVFRRSIGRFVKTINVGQSPEPIVITAKNLP